MEFVILSAILVGLLFCSGYFSGSEAALFSLSQHRVKTFAHDPNHKKRMIAGLLEHPKDFLVTVFMLNTLINILLQNVASHMFGSLANWVWKVGVPLILTLLFGEIIPKYIGMKNNIAFSLAVAPVLTSLHKLLRPIRNAVVAVTAPISRALFFFLKKDDTISKEELQHVLQTSRQHGILTSEEAQLVGGYLDLQDSLVKEIMRPRDEILFYDIHDPLSKLTHLFVDQQCSKIPLCNGDLQEIIGIMTAKTYFLYRHEIERGDELAKFISKPYYVPENTLAKLLLRRFNEIGEVIAIVVDEYGSISGLITREDLLEITIGQIADRRDAKPQFTKAGENEIIASGKLELDEFNEIFNTYLVSPNNLVTIGGWLIEQLGEIPKSGTKIELNGFLFHVLSAEPNRIRRLYIRNLKPERDK